MYRRPIDTEPFVLDGDWEELEAREKIRANYLAMETSLCQEHEVREAREIVTHLPAYRYYASEREE